MTSSWLNPSTALNSGRDTVISKEAAADDNRINRDDQRFDVNPLFADTLTTNVERGDTYAHTSGMPEQIQRDGQTITSTSQRRWRFHTETSTAKAGVMIATNLRGVAIGHDCRTGRGDYSKIAIKFRGGWPKAACSRMPEPPARSSGPVARVRDNRPPRDNPAQIRQFRQKPKRLPARDARELRADLGFVSDRQPRDFRRLQEFGVSSRFN